MRLFYRVYRKYNTVSLKIPRISKTPNKTGNIKNIESKQKFIFKISFDKITEKYETFLPTYMNHKVLTIFNW